MIESFDTWGRKAHYLLAVKENPYALHQALIRLFEANRNEPCPSNRLPMECQRTLEKDHGPIEELRGFVIRAANWLPARNPLWEHWRDLASVMCPVSRRTWTQCRQKNTGVYTRYLTSSSDACAERLIGYARSQWKIENNLHRVMWVMDVTFDEDVSRVRKGFEPDDMMFAY